MKKKYLFTAVMVLPFLGGLSRLFLLFFAAAVLCIGLIISLMGSHGLAVRISAKSVAGLLIIASGIVSFFMAVDRGTAFYGLLGLLALGLFALFIMQPESGNIEEAFCKLPLFCAAMIVICAAMYPIESLRRLVFSAGRLGGFFQYANTMALYILLALAVQLYTGELKKKRDIVILVILLFGLLWTGSRLTLIMAAALILWYGFDRGSLKLSLFIIVSLGAVAFLAMVVLGKLSSFARIFTMGRYHSTLWGRLLYWKDALPVIADNPLGIGYGGYMRVEHMIQTGVYTVRFIHNEYLQMALDHGVAAAVGFLIMALFALISAVRSKEKLRTILLVIILVHVFWDFDLQYYAVTAMLLIIIFYGDESGRCFIVKKPIPVVCSAVSASVFIWIGISQACFSAGDYKTSFTLYPYDSVCEEQLMYFSESDEEVAGHIEHILSLNKYSSAAYRMMAYFFSGVGDYEAVTDAIDNYLAIERYDMDAYGDMIVLLDACVKRLESEELAEMADALKEYFGLILKYKDEVEAVTDPLAYRLRDQPDFELPGEASEIIEKYNVK